MMTRKDYVRVSEILSNFNGVIDEFTFEDLIFEFGEFFSEDNPRFDFRKFEEACKVIGGND